MRLFLLLMIFALTACNVKAEETPQLGNLPPVLSGAYQFNYSNTKYSKERQMVFDFFQKEIEEMNSDKELRKKFGKNTVKNVSVDLYDLDGDGIREIVAVIYAYPTFCWGTGCSFFIFKQDAQGETITQIFRSGGKGIWFLGPESTNGYVDLKYYNDVPKPEVGTWKWNGTTYTGDFDGHKVNFAYVGYPREREKIYKKFEKEFQDEVRYREKEKLPHHDPYKSIGIDKYDINDDGKPELFVYLNFPLFCGSAGCAFYIFQEQDRELNPLWWKMGGGNTPSPVVYDKIIILPSKTNNYHDIRFASGYTAKWTGKFYQ